MIDAGTWVEQEVAGGFSCETGPLHDSMVSADVEVREKHEEGVEDRMFEIGRQGRSCKIGTVAWRPRGFEFGPAISCHLASRSSNGHRIFPCCLAENCMRAYVGFCKREGLVSF